MRDRVPLYPGRVKMVPVSGQENVYDMTRADQPTQQGDPLNKATLLKDATAALFGLGPDSVPDDVLEILSRFNNKLGNDYMWEKSKTTWEVVDGTQTSSFANWFSSFKHSKTVNISSTGKITLSSPEETRLKDIPNGEYVDFEGIVKKVDCSSNTLQYKPVSAIQSKVIYGYVNSPSPDAYPPSVPDGYTYTPLGQLGSKVRISTGSYVGTGKYGESNPNSLTFEFEPKMAIIGQQIHWTIWIKGMTGTNVTLTPNDDGYYSQHDPTVSGNTLTWYNSSASYQLNSSGATYYYIAIG